MPNQPIVTAGLVLRETVTRETDKILTVLTPDRGKISLIARGARRKNSRLSAASDVYKRQGKARLRAAAHGAVGLRASG